MQPEPTQRRIGFPGMAIHLAGLACMLAAAGCQLVSLASVATRGQQSIAASYPGLKGQRVGIMVWVDHAISIDHPSIQPDVAKGLQDKLQQAAAVKVEEVRDVKWMQADEILRFQEAHPELESESAAELAKRLDVTRLIYVEVSILSLHPDQSVDLSRGVIHADLQAIEVTNGQSKVAFQENDISAVYPDKSPVEGVTGLEDDDVYHHTVDSFTSELAKRFITHEQDAQ
ncbi:MAG: hypothetical protein M3O30_09175 [Planctomycetota bacterium]|nr:hypothetical protein [Planctomycetota bacterium]